MSQLIQNGRVRYAWLGVSTQTVTPKLAKRFGFAAVHGAAVQTVVGNSPAAKAGLRGGSREQQYTGITFRPGGDLIIAIDGRAVQRAEAPLCRRELPARVSRSAFQHGQEPAAPHARDRPRRGRRPHGLPGQTLRDAVARGILVPGRLRRLSRLSRAASPRGTPVAERKRDAVSPHRLSRSALREAAPRR